MDQIMANEQRNNPSGLTAEQALERLKQGNARFVAGESHFPTLQRDVRADLAKGQQPYATILGFLKLAAIAEKFASYPFIYSSKA